MRLGWSPARDSAASSRVKKRSPIQFLHRKDAGVKTRKRKLRFSRLQTMTDPVRPCARSRDYGNPLQIRFRACESARRADASPASREAATLPNAPTRAARCCERCVRPSVRRRPIRRHRANARRSVRPCDCRRIASAVGSMARPRGTPRGRAGLRAFLPTGCRPDRTRSRGAPAARPAPRRWMRRVPRCQEIPAEWCPGLARASRSRLRA